MTSHRKKSHEKTTELARVVPDDVVEIIEALISELCPCSCDGGGSSYSSYGQIGPHYQHCLAIRAAGVLQRLDKKE